MLELCHRDLNNSLHSPSTRRAVGSQCGFSRSRLTHRSAARIRSKPLAASMQWSSSLGCVVSWPRARLSRARETESDGPPPWRFVATGASTTRSGTDPEQTPSSPVKMVGVGVPSQLTIKTLSMGNLCRFCACWLRVLGDVSQLGQRRPRQCAECVRDLHG